MGAFVVKQEHVFEWPVKVQVPSAERPGHWDVQTFNATFKALPVGDARALRDAAADEDSPERHRLLDQVWLGWRDGDVLDGEKKPLPVTDETKAAGASRIAVMGGQR